MPTDYEFLQALCREKLSAFTQKAFTLIEPGTPLEWTWHLDCISEHLQAQYAGDEELRRLIITIPPRCLKSVLTAQIYPAWVLGREAHHQFIGVSYAHTLAERNVMKCRQLIRHPWYASTFKDTIIDQDKKDYFTTTLNGQYKGTGIGGTITGFGCKTLVIDDPISPKEAGSDTIRLNAISEIRSTLFSRFNKFSEGRLVLIMQRFHEQDPAGDLMKDGGYYVLNLPAENEEKTTISYSWNNKAWKMEPGQLLTPRLSTEDLAELRLNLGEANYSAQYSQRPVPLGGGEFKEPWLQIYHQGAVKPKEMNLVMLMDQAGGEQMNKKKKKLSDWTVIDVLGLASDNNYYLLDMVRDHLNPTDRIDTLFMMHRKWNALCGRPPKVGVEQIGMMTDEHYIREKQKQEAYHFSIVPLGGNQIKEERIRWLIPVMQQHRFYVPATLPYIDSQGRKFDLIEELKGEMRSFPKGRWDDILDSISRLNSVELYLQFPAPKVSMVQKSLSRPEPPDNWENW